MTYTTEDKRKDLIAINKERINRVFSASIATEKIAIIEDVYSKMSACRVNAEWLEWRNPSQIETGYSAEYETTTPRTADEMAEIIKQSGKAGLMG